jgi:hypothetical protein
MMPKRLPASHGDVFPQGAFLKGDVEPALDFQAPKREDGSRPQQRDKDTGQLLWQVTVIDADDDAGKKETVVTVKIASPVQPVPPRNTSPLPWTPVEFVGLTALPYIDVNGSRPRIAWSYRAEDIKAPGEATRKPADPKVA